MGSGSGIDSTLDAANILKPALARGTLRTVGATTQEEYQKHIEKDAALSRRFAKVMIEEPSLADSMAILQGLKATYEKHHHVQITDDAVETAVKWRIVFDKLVTCQTQRLTFWMKRQRQSKTNRNTLKKTSQA